MAGAKAATPLRQVRSEVRKALGRTPPKAPLHALQRAAVALGTGTPVRCSRFGAPGGCYLAVVAQEPARGAKRLRPGTASVLPRSASVQPRKIRRVGHDTAHAVIRRAGTGVPQKPRGALGGQPSVADLPDDRIILLYWIPPEIEVLLSRADLHKAILANKLLPVWSYQQGRLIERGDHVVRGAK